MMSHHDIHEIISQISQTLTCPKCKRRILPHQITISEIVNQDCFFEVCCTHCRTEMSLSAHVEKTPTEAAKTYNHSSRILHDSYVEEGITAEDVEAMRLELQHFCGSFTAAFAHPLF